MRHTSIEHIHVNIEKPLLQHMRREATTRHVALLSPASLRCVLRVIFFRRFAIDFLRFVDYFDAGYYAAIIDCRYFFADAAASHFSAAAALFMPFFAAATAR